MHAPSSGKCKDVLSFGPFILDSDDLLRIADKRVHLFPKQLEALRYLASKNGRVVSKDELLSQVWRDAFVGEGSLHHCISEIRKQLGNASGGVDVIETVAKRGYRFVLPVTMVESTSETKSVQAGALRVGILQFECKGAPSLADVADRLASRVAALLSHLRIIGLEITNQSALDRVSADPLTAARKLELSLLATGRLFHESGTGVGAEVEILRASDQTILSSCVVKAAHRRDLACKVASWIARQLPLPETGVEDNEIAEALEGGEECFDLYMKGLAHVLGMFSPTFEARRGDDLRLAIRFFTQATERHAGHLSSLIGLSNSVIFASGRGLISAEETLRLGLRASEAALAIDPGLPGARAAHAAILWAFDDKQGEGERELRDILDIIPFHFTATQFLAIGLMRDGRVHEAIQILRDFLEHRPDTAIFRSWLAHGLFLERKVESALREVKNCIERFPDWEVTWAQLSFISAYDGDYKTALEAGSRLSRITNNGSLLAMEAYGLARSGEKQRAEELVDYILAFDRNNVIHSALVPALIAVGKPYDALTSLEQAHRRRELWVPLILIDPRLAPIRSSPRFMQVRSSYPRLNIQGNAGRRAVQSAFISEISAKPA